MPLHNRINNKLLKERLKSEDTKRVTLSFYCYHQLTDPAAFRDSFYQTLDAIGTRGRIYVAKEGINAQISVPEARMDEFKAALDAIPFLRNIRLNTAIEDGPSFFKLKILVRKKIVADGLSDDAFNPSLSGTRLSASEFNKLTDNPETRVVDMRNHYESEIGHFRGAVCPDVDTFREAIPVVEKMLEKEKDKNIVLYCTGGIRCEKASAWLKHRGFKNVFQLEGGIIEYARQVKSQNLENKFIGKNFVFDERLGEQISNEIISTCHQCGKPCDTHTNCRNDGCHLLFIQCSECAKQYDGCCSDACKSTIRLPEPVQKELRKGINKGRQVFRKGRWELSLKRQS